MPADAHPMLWITRLDLCDICECEREQKKLEMKCSCCQIQYILVYSILLLLLYSVDVSFVHDVSSILLLSVYFPKRFCSINFIFKVLCDFDTNSFLMYMQYNRWLLCIMLLWCNEQQHAHNCSILELIIFCTLWKFYN